MKIIGHKDIPDFVSRYGKHITKSLLKTSLIQLNVPTNDELLLYGFKKKCLNVVKTHIKNGKLLEYLNKTNGKVKKQYIGLTINKYIDDLTIEQHKKNTIILNKIYNRLFDKYKLKFKDVDMNMDPITCEILDDPCYIIPDWNSGNKIVYNLKTLKKCKETQRVYTGFDVDENGQEYLYYRDVFTGSYISPFTKRKFDMADVRLLSCDIFE
jgi:hypothetical protein